MERLIHIYGLLAIALILMIGAAVAYLYWKRSREEETVSRHERKPDITREETRDALVFRDKDGYIINIIKK